MTDPQRPINTVNLGGVTFNSNHAQNYGLKPGNDGKLKYFINMKDGTKVEYSGPVKDSVFKFFVPPEASVIFNEDARHYSFENLEDADIDLSEAECNPWVSISRSKNIKVTGSKDNDMISIDNSENCEVDSGNGNDIVSLYWTKNTKVNAGEGNDIINLSDSERVDINGGSGSDNINVSIQNGAKLDGKVHLDNDDKLKIVLHSYSYEGADHISETLTKTAEIQGEGTHNLSETRGFDVHRTVTKENFDYDEDGYLLDKEPEREIIVDEHYKEE